MEFSLHVLLYCKGKLVHLLFPDPLLKVTLPPPAPELPAKHLAQRQHYVTGKQAPSFIRLSLCIIAVFSFNICAPDTSVPAAEDDAELMFAASQCEVQLTTGVAYDTNAYILSMFCENAQDYFLKENHHFLICFVYNTELHQIMPQAGCIL